MINTLPTHVYLTWTVAVLYTLVLFYIADNKKKRVVGFFIIWGFLHSILAFSGFYDNTMSMPPRVALLMLPMFIIIIAAIFYKPFQDWMASLDLKYLTWLHVVRIPVELTLFWLFCYKFVPEIMTFEGRNFDILAGLTAPLAVWLGFRAGSLNKTVLWVWNIFSILLLTNIMITAVLSMPTVFQQFGFEQPNVAVYQFPFILLPGIVVPLVLTANIAAFIILRRS